MLEKATFFVLQTSYTNELKGLYIAGNSYPYYQDKKKLVFTRFKNQPQNALIKNKIKATTGKAVHQCVAKKSPIVRPLDSHSSYI